MREATWLQPDMSEVAPDTSCLRCPFVFTLGGLWSQSETSEVIVKEHQRCLKRVSKSEHPGNEKCKLFCV